MLSQGISLCCIFLTLFLQNAFAFKYNILVPPNNGEDDYQGPTQGLSRISGQENDFYTIVNFINDYLIFFVALIALIAVLYTGYKFISNPEEATTAGKNVVLSIGLGLFFVVFAYAIVRIITNLL